MKTLRAFTCSLAALTFSAIVHAAPVQYQLTAFHTAETIGSENGTSAQADTYLFSTGTQISATFFYDSATLATSINNASPSPLFGYGFNSYYTNSITNFVGTVSDFTFSSLTGDTIVANGPLPNISIPTGSGPTITIPSRDGVINISGENDTGFPPTGSITGFSVGDFSLAGYSAFVVGDHFMLPDQSLPTLLSSLNDTNTGIHLLFKNSAGENRIVKFWGGSVTPVPLPNSALFFLSGLIGLGANIFRKAKK